MAEIQKKMLSLENLRAMMQPQRKYLPYANLHIPVGALTAISGSGKTSFVSNFIAEHPELRVVWIESKFSIFPFAILQKKISLDRILFVEAGEQCEWTVLQVLKSQVFSIVVLYTEQVPLKSLRRFQIASEKAGASFIWLTSHPQLLWPIHLEIEVKKAQEVLTATVLRQR